MALDFGLQVFSVRRAMGEDFFGTLERIAEIGYKYIEFANHRADEDFGVGFGVDAEVLRNHLDKLGLKVIGNHVGPINNDNIEQIVKYNKTLGNTAIGEGIGFWKNKKEVIDFAKGLNKKGELLNENGIQFYYHNHFMEFQEFDGNQVIEILLENTSPKYVQFEIDLYWAYRAGLNRPEDFVASLGKRCSLVHLKDIPVNIKHPNIFDTIGKNTEIDMDVFTKFTTDEFFTEIGSGSIGADRLVKAMFDNENIKCLIVEQDRSQKSELESIEISYKYMRNLLN